MRAFGLLVAAVLLVVVAGVGTLVGASDTRSIGVADVGRMLSSVEDASDVQLGFALYAPRDPVSDFSAVVDESAPPGATISVAGARVSTQLFVFLERQPLLQEITVSSHRYVKVDLTPLAPGLPTAREQAALAALQRQIGDRWLSLPGVAVAPDRTSSELSSIQALLTPLEQAVVAQSTLQAIGGGRYVPGVVLRGDLAPVGEPLEEALAQLVTQNGLPVVAARLPTALHGRFRVTLTCTPTGSLHEILLSVDGRGRGRGRGGVGLGVVIDHSPIPVTAPPGAERFPPPALRALIGFARQLVAPALV